MDSDRLTDIRERWAGVRLSVGRTRDYVAGAGDLTVWWAREEGQHPGDPKTDEANREAVDVLRSAPEDVAWLVAEVERSRNEDSRAASAVEYHMRQAEQAERERDEARQDRDSAEATIARLQKEIAGHASTLRIAVEDRDAAVRERDEARALLEQSLAWATPELRERIRAALREGGSGE